MPISRLAPLLAALGLVASLLGLGCAGSRLKSRAGVVSELVDTARTNGAQVCAPVELAMAESHLDFAKQDLSEGNYHRAREELAIAETNAHQAVAKSPKERCAPKAPPKPRKPTDKDTDGDGLVDRVDNCPKNPEDLDGFEDTDGCPDPDNDTDGILDADDQCPLKPEDKDGFTDEDGCPDEDNDGDGILDAEDRCPRDPEDKDGFTDEDGCPDLDNDSDGITDADDKCPNEAEDKDGFADDDGCPDCDNDGDGVLECPTVVDKCPASAANTPDGCPQYKLVTVTETKIEIKQTIYFATNKARIKPISFPLLNEVVQALKDNPGIKVRIEGHTDSRGSDRSNMRLSQARASAVRDYLIKGGIDKDRMIAQGYGETVPIADNRTDAGRAQNRRVEFVITAR